MKNFYALLLLASTLVATGCEKKKEVKPSDPVVNLTAVLNGNTQAPNPNNTTAKGTLIGTYNKDTREITYTIRYQGMTPTMGHFHQGAPGTAGPLSVPFPQLNDPIVGRAILSADDGQKILANAFYANLHSSQYPGGELRGDIQIVP